MVDSEYEDLQMQVPAHMACTTSERTCHVDGCRRLEKPPQHLNALTNSSRQVDSICHFLSLLARTTSHEP